MSDSAIVFGTDGWRGVIAEDFTFQNVRIAAAAIGNYIHSYEDASRGVCIGWDTRFLSEKFALAVAETLAASGIPVKLADRVTPTPALSFDYLQPQSRAMERREIQGQLRRIGKSGDHGDHRRWPGQATTQCSGSGRN